MSGILLKKYESGRYIMDSSYSYLNVQKDDLLSAMGYVSCLSTMIPALYRMSSQKPRAEWWLPGSLGATEVGGCWLKDTNSQL